MSRRAIEKGMEMGYNFDALAFAKRQTEAGEKREVAEAHAFALQLTFRMGGILVVAIGVLASLRRLI
jgi:hypothetical protein